MSDPTEPQFVDGGPIGAAIVDQASEWLVKLWSGVATAADHDACARWRAAHADHERAWQRLQALEQKLEVVPRDIANKTLQRPAVSRDRRRVLKGLSLLIGGSALTYAAGRTATWQRYGADYRTDIGEVRTIVLSDSTRVTLNTASAIDVRFDAAQRRIDLRAGEIMVSTSHDPHVTPRPFIVSTAQGTVRALGTRFVVRQTDDDVANVAVFEGAVLIHPNRGTGQSLRLDAGQQTSFSRTSGRETVPADENTSAWASGSLMVERIRLDDFIAELSRYRPGLLRCDPAAGHYLLTGVYPLADTDRILASVEKALPIKVIYRSRYWVTVTTRDPPA